MVWLLADLAASNGLSASPSLSVGQALRIPGRTGTGNTGTGNSAAVQPVAAPSVSAASVAPAGTQQAVHQVAAGETLYAIARQYGVDVNALIAANGNLNPSQLSVGQSLIIPGQNGTAALVSFSAPSSQTHSVAAGETLYAIARQYGVGARR